MRLGTAVVTGAVQGVAESLPISSSAHLSLLREMTGADLTARDSKAIDVAVHLGSLLGPLALLARRRLGPRDLLAAAVVSFPAAVVGGVGRRQIENRLGQPRQLAVVGAAAALGVWWVDRRGGTGRTCRPHEVGTRALLAIGAGQAAALAPGVSRSGVTYATARACGLDRSSAADMALVTAIPVILGAGALLAVTEKAVPMQAAPAMAAAAASSLLMAPATRPALMRGSGLFAAYRVVLGAALLLKQRQEHP